MFESLVPVKRETLQSIVHTRLCNLILEGELAPGESVTVASIAKALDATVGLRVSSDEELTGLDQTQHAETAYVD